MAEEVEGLEIPVTEEEWAKGGSKFVTIPPKLKVGDTFELDIEMGIPDWDTPGKSFKFPVTVTEAGPDEGKEDKISGGALPGKTWKVQETYRAVTGGDPPLAKGKDGIERPRLIPSAIAGKPAVGVWTVSQGPKGGVPGAELVLYPKLTAILPPGSKVESLT